MQPVLLDLFCGRGWLRSCNRRPLVAVWLAVMALGVAVALLVRDVRIDTKEGIGQLDPFNSFLVTLLIVNTMTRSRSSYGHSREPRPRNPVCLRPHAWPEQPAG